MIGGERIQKLQNLSQGELESMSVDWTYDDILRDVKKYQGKIIHFKGPIITTDTVSDDRVALQVRIDCKPWPDSYDCNDMIVDYTGKRLLVDDKVEVWGTVERVDEIEIVLRGEELMPIIKAIKVNCVNCPN